MTIENENKLIQLRTTMLETLSSYLKAMRTDGSWIQYYISHLKLKPPSFSFKESKIVFESKLQLLLDIMDLAHLYCKISNPKDYNHDNHITHKATVSFIVNRFAQLNDDQYYELRHYLKNNVMFGLS